MKTHKTKGFTLIEMMVVIAILGILAVLVVPQIMSRPEQAKLVKAHADVMALENALDLYKLDNGFYPSTDQGLNALVKKPDTTPTPQHWKAGGYLKRLPLDPWGTAYQYLNPGNHSDIDIYSYGPNGENIDMAEESLIGNWEETSDEKKS